MIVETRDRRLLRAIFARDPIGAIYMLGDLEDPAFAASHWFVNDDRAVLLVYEGLSVPVILPFGDAGALHEILAETDLPSRFYTKLTDEQRSLFTAYTLADADELYVMGLDRLAPAGPASGLTCRIVTSADEILPLYADYPGNYFDPSQVNAGVYAAAEMNGRLAGAAGTHAWAPSVHAAALGNVVTAAASRGCGVCRSLMAFLCRELNARGCRHIGLHVNRGNAPAIACYRRIGFSIHSAVTQWTATAI